jgi:uroporphyrinogen decarboxylase
MATLNSRELVRRALRFEKPARIPRDLWTLPWAETHYPAELAEIRRRFPPDIIAAPPVNLPSPRLRGDPYTPGIYTDEWGCSFVNIQAGAIGEVRDPIVSSAEDWARMKPPYEILPTDLERAREDVARFCSSTDKFVLGEACPRPWERYQFLRGTFNAMMDMGMIDDSVRALLQRIHQYYMRELEFWVATDVDAVRFMDDWGAQNRLLIAPHLWREIFKPLYKEYADLAHSHGKFIFMHSDGHIEEIFPDLVETGIDAVNSQLFCMDLEKIRSAVQGRITFWGEIDRQHVLPSEDPEVGRQAVRQVAQHLYDPRGGMIAQLEFGLAANPGVVSAVFEEWERIGGRGV